MKDAKGHGSNKRPIPGHQYHAKTSMELRYIQKDAHEAGRNAQGMGDQKGVNKYADQVNDASTVLAYRARGGTSDAPADQLHSGTSKSDPAPIHDSMQASRLASAHASMGRLKETFHAGNGDNRYGEYGRNVREAYDRHAAVVHEITGKRPNIYDR